MIAALSVISFTEYFSNFSKFISGEYYQNLFSHYFSVTGYIGGAILLAIIYYVSTIDDRFRDIFKVIAALAVIQSGASLNVLICQLLGSRYTTYSLLYYMSQPNNIISGFILLMIVFSWMKYWNLYPFAMGGLVYLVSLLMNSNAYVSNWGFYILISLFDGVMVGLICMFAANREHFYSGWLLYFIYHIFSRLFTPFMYYWLVEGKDKLYGGADKLLTEFLQSVLQNYQMFTFEIIFFAVIFLYSFIFKRKIAKDA
ncbi:MAG: hypothetical protein IJ861_10450 [Clostridia bacterium]|nr:hypothetical protein [Clostridia bacterium]